MPRRSFAFDERDQPALDRMDALDDFRRADSTEGRAVAAGRIRALDSVRRDSVRLDARLERPSRVRAARWLGAAGVRAIDGDDRGADRRVMAAVIAKADPDRAAWAESVSEDELRRAFDELEDPPEQEKTDAMSKTINPVVLARAGRIVRSAYRFRADADEPTRADLAQLSELIKLSKAEGIAMNELLDALERLKQIDGDDPTKRTDAREPDGRVVTLPGGGMQASRAPWLSPVARRGGGGEAA